MRHRWSTALVIRLEEAPSWMFRFAAHWQHSLTIRASERGARDMTRTTDNQSPDTSFLGADMKKATVGNIIAIIMTTLFSLGLMLYAIYGDDTGRIGRNWEAAALTGMLGAVVCGLAAIKAIQARRR